jgi:hypothetical protein
MQFMLSKRKLIKPVHPATIALLTVAMGTTAGLSQPTSFDGAYKGSLECKRTSLEAVRMPLAILIRDGRVIGGGGVDARR